MILGIDLGTTNSLACAYKDGKVIQIPNFAGDYLTPSVVSIDDDGSIIVGAPAKERRETYPDRTFSSFKRFMGTGKKFDKFSPEELSSFVLRSLKQDAEKFLGEKIEDVIISVPAYFNDKARNATKDAGTLAGLNVLRIINEPSAAALGYLMKADKLDNLDNVDGFEDNTFLVFDFGGGTLDVSLVEAFENVIEILSVSGDNMLGGIDFDKALADEFLKRKNIKKSDISDKTYNAVLSAAERCKRELTDNSSAKMIVHSKEIEDEIEITDKEFLRISEAVIKRITRPINKVLLDSRTSSSDIADVILVGGSSKMPIVQQYLKYLMKGLAMEVYEPDCMIAYGMGVYAGIMERQEGVKDLLLTDVCPFSLGTGIVNRENVNSDDLIMSFIIPRNSALPISRTESYTPVREGQTSIRFQIFQGEEMYVKDNKKIGEMIVDFGRPSPKNTQVLVTFTYDVNGILLVNYEVPSLRIKGEVVIEDSERTSKTDKNKKVEYLRQFKLLSQEDEDNRMIREWGQKLFAIAPSPMREDIQSRLQFFEYIVKADPYQAIKFKKNIKSFFVAMEIALSKYSMSNWAFDDSWEEDEEVDEEMESIFREWEEGDHTDK